MYLTKEQKEWLVKSLGVRGVKNQIESDDESNAAAAEKYFEPVASAADSEVMYSEAEDMYAEDLPPSEPSDVASDAAEKYFVPLGSAADSGLMYTDELPPSEDEDVEDEYQEADEESFDVAEQRDQTFAPADAGPTPAFAKKDLGRDYRHEDEGVGFRGTYEEPAEADSVAHLVWEKLAKRKRFVMTDYWDDEEREKNEVLLSDEGVAYQRLPEDEAERFTGDGDALPPDHVADPASGAILKAIDTGGREIGYVVDPDTGKTYLFDGTSSVNREILEAEKASMRADLNELEQLRDEALQTLRGITWPSEIEPDDESIVEADDESITEADDMDSAADSSSAESVAEHSYFSPVALEDSYEEDSYEEESNEDDPGVVDALMLHLNKLLLARSKMATVIKGKDGYKEKEREVEEHRKEFLAEADARNITPEQLKLVEEYGELERGVKVMSVTVEQVDKDGTSLQMAKHHSSPLAGGAVAGAGEVELEQGRVTKVSNVSGHYRPEFVQMAQTIEHLMRQGALLDKTVARYDATTGKGKNLEDSDDPKDAKLLKLYLSVTSLVRKQTRQGQTLAAKAKAVEQRLISLGEDATEEEIERGRAEIGEINAALGALADEVTGPMDLLRREGVGPANRASGEVEFLESVQDLGGAAVHEAKVRALKSNPQEFLSTGGGSRQADKAGDMRAELSDLKRLRDGDPDPGWDPAKLKRLEALDKKVPAFPSDQDEEESEASTGLPPAPLPPPSESDIDAALERMTVAAAIEGEDDESDESFDWDDMLPLAYVPEPDAEDGQVFDHEYDEDI